MSCHLPNKKKTDKRISKDTINIALAGNPNVGKSVIFNQLTGLSQTIGNWPGKTVERMEGYLDFLGYHFNIVDLPGIYSLSTYSLEEIVSREYIVSDEVDVIINVIDATNLERNLFFTFQLLELKVPMILAINQMDLLRKKNIELDFKKMEKIFQLPVVPVVAVHGTGVHQLLEETIEMLKHHQNGGSQNKSHDYYHNKHSNERLEPNVNLSNCFQFPDLTTILSFGKEVETRTKTLTDEITELSYRSDEIEYPPRFIAIKVMEDDVEIKKLIETIDNALIIIENAGKYRSELEELHGEDINTIISSEIYSNIHKLIDKIVFVKEKKPSKKRNLGDIFEHLTSHSIWGYVILILVVIGIYLFTFSIGDFFGGLLDEVFVVWSEQIYLIFGETNVWIQIFWNGGMGGFFGAITGVLLYVIPFFFVIEILQDSGYLPRAAFLLDKFMHSIGVHGKTIIPMILGFGCNVPACAGCRIMETQREKKISIALTSLIPCAAVMVVVMGLVGRYLGVGWILFLFAINFAVIILVGRILNKVMPGKCTELIMEMHDYRMPNNKVIFKQTWLRTKEFIFKALPLIVVLGIVLEILLIFDLLSPINTILYPVTVLWLGLPASVGVFLIYGILRKELTLVLLEVMAFSLGLSVVDLLNPIQMITFCMVTMLYIPCFATVVVIARQTSWKYALQICLLEIGLALLIGGVFHFSSVLFVGFFF